MSYTNRSNRHLLVTSVFAVGEYAHFVHEFRADAYGLATELIDTTDALDAGAAPASYLLWRYDNSPALPSDANLGPFVAQLAEFLETGHGAIVALVAPGQALQSAPALLVGHDGGLWLGTVASLQADPGPYRVRDFDAYVLAHSVDRAATPRSPGIGSLTHGG